MHLQRPFALNQHNHLQSSIDISFAIHQYTSKLLMYSYVLLECMMSSKLQVNQARRRAHRSARVYKSRTMPNSSTEPTNEADASAFTDIQDYFNYQPGLGSRKRDRFRRLHVPDPLQIHPHSSSPLSAGPAGYQYTPLFLRTPDLESLRHDHGVQFKKHLSLKEVVLYARWHLLLDEDALPYRMKEHSKKSLKTVKKFVRHKIKNCEELWGELWGSFTEEMPSSQAGVVL